MKTLFLMSLAWLFILSEYVMRSVAYVRRMNAKPSGRHAGGRHLAAVVAAELAYIPRGVDGDGKPRSSHRRRQGMLAQVAYREAVAA